MNSIERSKKICISSLQLHVQGFSPVCQVSSILDYYAVKNLHHIDYIDKDNSYNNFTYKAYQHLYLIFKFLCKRNFTDTNKINT